MRVKIISKEDKAQNENPIERSFAKILTYGFAEKSNMSIVAKVALNTSVSKRYKLESIKEYRPRGITAHDSISNSDVVDFREVNQKIINKLGQSNFLINLPKGVRVVG